MQPDTKASSAFTVAGLSRRQPDEVLMFRIIFLAALAMVSLSLQAAEPVWEGRVVSVTPNNAPPQGWANQGRYTGSAVGAAVGAYATRNRSHSQRAIGGLVGGTIGGAIGTHRDRQPISGWDVVVCHDGNGRCEAIFTRYPPGVQVGERAFVARDRIIPARGGYR